MDFMPWTALLFQSIPEEIILVTLGLALVGQYPRMKGIIAVGIGGAIFSFLFRRLLFDFGVHTLALILVLGLLMRFILQVEFVKGLIAAFLGILALGIIESATTPVISFFTGISIKEALEDPWLRVLFPLPDEIILGIIAYFCRKHRFSLLFGERLVVNSTRKGKKDEK